MREQLNHVAIEVGDRQRVLEAGVAILNQRLVVEQKRRALGHHHHLQLARGLDDHLPDVAPLLVVALDAERTDRLHAPQMRQSIVVVLDDRLDGSSAP